MRASVDHRIAIGGDGDHMHGLAVAAQFFEQIKIVLARIRMAGNKHHHQRFVIDQRFRAVTEPGWGVVKRDHFSGGKLQHFERRFPSCRLQSAAAEIDDALPGLITEHAVTEIG
ncbi:hypothetical protein D3C81_1674580 [compost metagenome]